MRFLVLAVAMSALLLGCATTANYEKILDSWVGRTEIDLVRQWGPPDKVYENGGIRLLTFARSSQGYVPGVAPSYQTTRIGNTYSTTAVGGSPGYVVSRVCNTTFEISNDRIVTWRWQGNACKATAKD